MKKKFLSIVIMLLAVAATVTLVAFLSSWIAPKEPAAPAAAAQPTAVPVVVEVAVVAPPTAVPVVTPPTAAPVIPQPVEVPEKVQETETEAIDPVAEPQVDASLEEALKKLLAQSVAPANPLIGVWEMSAETIESSYASFGDLKITLEFFEDGKYSVTITMMGIIDSVPGEYSFEENQLSINGTPTEYALDGDQLTLMGDMNGVYNRVPAAN